MGRNLHVLKEKQYVDVTCIDTDKTVRAELITQTPDFITIELSGRIRISLQKHKMQQRLYIGSANGLEFECYI